MKLLGICGSLRRESYNLKLLKALEVLLPSSMSFSIAMLHDIPLYNEDEEAISFPPSVQRLVEEILVCDAIIFGSPEYNYSISGVLKNAIDWASRHPKKPFSGKLATLIGASPGRLGTARAQYHLRQVGVFLDLKFLNRPEVMVSEAHKKFGPDGGLNDENVLEHLKKLIVALQEA